MSQRVIAMDETRGLMAVDCREYGSAKTMDSLRSLASPTAHVIRDGNVLVIPSGQVVVGDVVEIKTGSSHLQISLVVPRLTLASLR